MINDKNIGERSDNALNSILKIGELCLKSNIILAPMAGVTDSPFRQMVRFCGGVGLMCTEMISSRALVFNDQKTRKLLPTEAEYKAQTPISVQIFGNNPQVMHDSVEHIPYANVIDINMGCPAKKIIKNGDGGALMRDKTLIGEIVAAVAEGTRQHFGHHIPVTAKIRLGCTNDTINAPEIAEIIAKNGAAAITVHGRTVEQEYRGKADWNAIADVVKSVDIPIIANGDVATSEDIDTILDITNASGVMIGRAALGNPRVLAELEAEYKGLGALPKLSLDAKIELALKHLDVLVDIKGERIGIKEARKHMLWYLKGVAHAQKLKQNLVKANTKEQMRGLFNEFKAYIGNMDV
ncbi:MAG: tRNA dihydrouridine synthase DusB [Clostridiales bacterium]|jgi:tRNA-dihydrouridine synthase B|nr:tRNA dihydrouridine synthase DusB [Clostridiales bacterium]